MKRFVYIPPTVWNGEIPSKALKMAEDSALPIRIGENGDGFTSTDIEIISIPEVSRCDVPDTGLCGYVFPIDITNEFVVFDKSTSLTLSNELNTMVFGPRLMEKHRARFRPRLEWTGDTHYSISVNDTVLASGVFTSI